MRVNIGSHAFHILAAIGSFQMLKNGSRLLRTKKRD